MGLLSFLNPFGKKQPTDYDTILNRLATEISDAKLHLSEIRLRERRFSLLVNAYGILLWAVWTGLWWFRGIPWGLVGLVWDEAPAMVLGVAGVMLGPVGIIALNRLNRVIYTNLRTKEENHLRKLLTQQHTKLEEIKKATNYYSTKSLLDKYDESNSGFMSPAPVKPNKATNQPTPTPASKGPIKQNTNGTPSLVEGPSRGPSPVNGLSTPVRQGSVGMMGSGTPVVPGHLAPGTPMTPQQVHQLQMLQQSQMQPVLPTPNKKWYDHLADKLMGEDPSQAAQTKFALVCGGCFRHNGLVGGKEQWEKTQWICPRCNFFNPAPKPRPGHDGLPATSSASSLLTNGTPSRAASSGRDMSTPLRQRLPASSSGLARQVFTASKAVGDGDGDGDVSMGDGMDIDEEEEGGR